MKTVLYFAHFPPLMFIISFFALHFTLKETNIAWFIIQFILLKMIIPSFVSYFDLEVLMIT